MLALTPLRSSTVSDRAGDVSGAANLPTSDDFSVDFDFDFSEFFAGFDDAELLPDLDIDAGDLLVPEASAAEVQTSGGTDSQQEEREEEMILTEEVLSCEVKEEASEALEINSPASSEKEKEKERRRKPSAGQAKGSNGKRKLKVDWTAELHRRFVQAVEQLGVEKAVPSRILELMGINCLTRHNVASHLQKYRSHLRHSKAREETPSSSQRRQGYGAWLPPSATCIPSNAPPPPPPPPPPHLHHRPHVEQQFRPLHVWGHPTMSQALVQMWPKHMVPVGPTAGPPWGAPHPVQATVLPPHASAPWLPHFARGTFTQGMPYFPQPLPALRFPALPVPGMPLAPLTRRQTNWLVQHDGHPSNESIDAALGDVLAQPWLPLPLGLKPPSLESVMVELQKQGISNVPPCS